MARLELTVIARSPQLLLARAQALGLDRGDLLAASGFTEPELQDLDARVSRAKMIHLWRRVGEALPDPALGLRLGASVSVRELGLIGYMMQFSTTLGQAFTRLCRFSRLLADDTLVLVEAGPERAELVGGASLELVALRHPLDARAALALAVARELTGTDIEPLEVRLPHAPPPDPRPYRRFFSSPVHFHAGATALAFTRRDLDLPIPAGDATLGSYLEEYAEVMLRSLPAEASLAERLRGLLSTELSDGQPGLERLAGRLGVSPRTLQRQLRAEGTTFQEVLDDFRRTMAVDLLANRELAIKEVAFLLGYGDLSAFYRAFRRWYGRSPQSHRREREIA